MACNKPEIKRIDLSVGEFNVLVFNSYFKVVLIQGDENSAWAEGSEGFLKKLKTSEDNMELSFEQGNKSSWLNPKSNDVTLYITVKDLHQIRANETCDISSQNTLTGEELGIIFASKLNEAKLNLDYKSVYYWNNFPCGGKLDLSGSCELLSIWNFALMQVDAQNLSCKVALIENSSKGNCTVHVSDYIKYSIYGSGNIHCYGNPPTVVKEETSSTGIFSLK